MVKSMKYKVGKYYLDKEQTNIVLNENSRTLVVAGAGSGKTLTILGKIKYLIEEKNIDPREIICISFTNAASNDLKRKIKEEIHRDIPVYTFHKLSLEILKNYNSFDIADASLLDDIIEEFFNNDIYRDESMLYKVKKYFGLKRKDSFPKYSKSNFKEVTNLKHLLSTFIRLFKSSAYEVSSFLEFIDRAKETLNIKKYKREKIFLTLALNIYMIYTDYLEKNNEIDFDDMLTLAKKTVDKFGFFHSIEYIIIDEYQDTSLVRFNLVKSILDKTGASLLAVGDDFQSIYRFTGCDLSLFLDFKKMFPEGEILKIQTTYRNSQELIEVAGNFIMKNKKQMNKKLRSDKKLSKPFIIYKYESPKDALTKMIKMLYKKDLNDIMILGRNNNDIYNFLDKEKFKIDGDKIILLEEPNVSIRYLTSHRSKGLESENVIVINMTDDLLGFPNKIVDDKILRFVSPHIGKIPFDEERRLFYVAITRTKNKTYFLVPKNGQSEFITEFEKDYKSKIEYIKKVQ